MNYNIKEILIKLFTKLGADAFNLDKSLEKVLQQESVKCIVDLLVKNGVGFGGLASAQITFNPNHIGNTKKILQLLLKNSLDSDFRTSRGENLLHLFVQRVNRHDRDAVDVVEILLDSGLPVNVPNHRGFSPLLTSIRRQNVPFVQVLISKGANVNQTSQPSGLFPLYRAAQCNNLDLVDYLLNNGAEVNAKISSGRTALHAACFWGNDKIISSLISKGADVAVVSKDGKTPFFLLDKKKDYYEECVYVMVKEFSKLLFEKVPIPEINLELMAADSTARDCFESCMKEINQMDRTIFYGSYSYYSVLKLAKNVKTLAELVKNDDFVRKFEARLSFSHYESDLKMLLNEAIKIKDKSRLVQDKKKSALNGFSSGKGLKQLNWNLFPEFLQ